MPQDNKLECLFAPVEHFQPRLILFGWQTICITLTIFIRDFLANTRLVSKMLAQRKLECL